MPALSGLAQAFRAMYGTGVLTGDDDYYLSGIWRADLARGLLWTPHDGSRTSRRSKYVAPTWSWASINGQIHFQSQSSGSPNTPNFLGIGLEREADNHLRPVIATKLTLLAKVRLLGYVVKKAEVSWYPLDLRIGGKSIGNGAFDANNTGDKSTIWLMECTIQERHDFRDHPPALLLHNPEREKPGVNINQTPAQYICFNLTIINTKIKKERRHYQGRARPILSCVHN